MRSALSLASAMFILCSPAQASGQHDPYPRRDQPVPPPPAPLFVSPMGEPFRGEKPERLWFDGTDANRDGRITLREMEEDADRFHRALDTARDGEIDPDDMARYEGKILPEIQVMPMGDMPRRGMPRGMPGGPPPGDMGPPPGARRGGEPLRMGAARFSWLNIPQPVTSADLNMNRGVDRDEFRRTAGKRFLQLDANRDGALTLDELPALPSLPDWSRLR